MCQQYTKKKNNIYISSFKWFIANAHGNAYYIELLFSFFSLFFFFLGNIILICNLIVFVRIVFVQCLSFCFIVRCHSAGIRSYRWYQFIGTHWLVKRLWSDWLSNELKRQRHTVRIAHTELHHTTLNTWCRRRNGTSSNQSSSGIYFDDRWPRDAHNDFSSCYHTSIAPSST